MFQYKNIILVLIAFLFMGSTYLFAENRQMQVKVYFDTKEEVLQLQSLHPDIVFWGDDYYEIIVTPQEYEDLQEQGFTMKVIHADVVQFYSSRLLPDKDMGGYMTLSEINAKTDTIIMDHPDIVSSKISLGQTIEGRDMWAFKISDNPNVDEEETEVLYTAAIHAREVITPLVIFYFVDHITDNYATDPDIQYLVDNREIWIVPCVNPDGYYYNEVIEPFGGGMWRKNRRDNGDGSYGVDLNRNYGYMWGFDNYGSSPYTDDPTYRGTAPFSEPEIQNMRDFHIAHEFIISVYFHSHANAILWPWGYDELYTTDNDIFAIMGDSMAAMNGYEPGTVWEAINYVANGASDDWIYAEETLKDKTFAMTFEVGGSSDGFWPNPNRIPALTSENLDPLLFLTRIADSVYAFRAPIAPIVYAPDSAAENTDYDINWSFNDSLNPAVSFELTELWDLQETTDSANDFDNCTNKEFTVSSARKHSNPTSFFSGAQSNKYRYVQYEFPFPIEQGDSLRFWTWYDIENHWDYAYVEVATDGQTFMTIPGNITTDWNPNGNNRGNGITGSSGTWVEGLFSLSEFEGETISLRLSYRTDAYVLEEGIYYDDIYPVDIFNNEAIYTISGDDTSYTISGHTEGEYYYKARAKDGQEQWSYFSPAEQTIVYQPTDYVCGDANGDEAVNVADAVFIVNYIFTGGSPAPDPLEAADVDCESNVNISDSVYIINYIFAGGNAPCDPDGDGIPNC